jgi:hypothetical protein
MAMLIDMMILLLLVGTLAYAFLVDRRVRALMVAMRALEPVVDQFSLAVDRTETSVRHLRATAKREDEPPLTRASAATAPRAGGAGEQPSPPAQPTGAAPAQLPPGMARVTGKADLVRSFFDTVKGREA